MGFWYVLYIAGGPSTVCSKMWTTTHSPTFWLQASLGIHLQGLAESAGTEENMQGQLHRRAEKNAGDRTNVTYLLRWKSKEVSTRLQFNILKTWRSNLFWMVTHWHGGKKKLLFDGNHLIVMFFAAASCQTVMRNERAGCGGMNPPSLQVHWQQIMSKQL